MQIIYFYFIVLREYYARLAQAVSVSTPESQAASPAPSTPEAVTDYKRPWTDEQNGSHRYTPYNFFEKFYSTIERL